MAISLAAFACLLTAPVEAKPPPERGKAVEAKPPPERRKPVEAKPPPDRGKPAHAGKQNKASSGSKAVASGSKATRPKKRAATPRRGSGAAAKAAGGKGKTRRVVRGSPAAQGIRSTTPPAQEAVPQQQSARRRAAPTRRRAGARRSGVRARAASPSTSPSPARSETAAPAAPEAAAPAAGEPAKRSPSADRRARSREPAGDSEGSGPVRAVTEVIERVPGRLWALLGAIAGLALLASAGSVLGWVRTRRAERQRRQVMEDVGLLQAALLPPLPDDLGPLQLSAAYRPAEGPAAGGDFYDALPLRGGRVGLVIGDVSGHGRTALAQTALVRFTVRAYLEAGLEPRDALKLTQSALEGKLADGYVSILLATYDPDVGRLTYAGAGHPPPLLRGGLPAPAVTVASSPVIGAGIGTGLRQTTMSLASGTTICLYTDGLVEARIGHDMLGTNKLAGLLDELGQEATAAQLLDRVIETADRANDDMAVCLVRVAPQSAGDPARYLVEELELVRRDVGLGVAERFLAACRIPEKEAAVSALEANRLCGRFGSALLRVHRHEHPQRVQVEGAAVDGLALPKR